MEQYYPLSTPQLRHVLQAPLKAGLGWLSVLAGGAVWEVVRGELYNYRSLLEVILPLLLMQIQPRHCRPLQRGDLRDCGRHLRGEELGHPRHPRRAVVEPGAGAAAPLYRPGLVTVLARWTAE